MSAPSEARSVLHSWLAPMLLAGLASSAAYRARALTPGGALAATLVGAAAFHAGWNWAVLLALFFLSSSALSRTGSPAPGDTMVAKGDRRDALQVLANGGIAALCAFVWPLWSIHWFPAAYAGALAAATADTWASEIGIRSPRPPRHLLTRLPVPPGTSGGVTGTGLRAAVVGAALIAAGSSLLPHSSLRAILTIAAAGWLAALADSLLGATAQEVRFCPTCGQPTEQTIHARCGTSTQHLRGIAGLDNDAVNALATALGALLAIVLPSLSL